jgi:RNA polymerase sigma-70 factor (ECF subfamily)
MNSLVELLAADVVLYGDGGGKVPSWPKPIVGRDKVVRLLLALRGAVEELGIMMRHAEVNGQPGAMFFDASGRLINVWSLDIADGRVQTVRSVINPEKLGHLGPLADVAGLLDRFRRP